LIVILGSAVIGGFGSFAPCRGDVGDNQSPASPSAAYRSPMSVAISPDGTTVYASDHTAGNVSIIDVLTRTKRGEITLNGKPHGVALSRDGGKLYVAEHGAGTVAVVDTSTSRVTSRIGVGRWPTGLVVGNASQRLFVCNQDSHTVTVVDLAQSPPATIREIPVIREPACVAITPDERYLVVTNLLPLGAGTDAKLSAAVSVIDTQRLGLPSAVTLPAGSTVVQGVCSSPAGRWAYVVHGLGRFNLPITQLERGWVNTYALSILDILQTRRVATVLLDDLMQGAANPHSVVCSGDGQRLWISHTGVHEVSTVEIGRIHELLAGNVPDSLASLMDGTRPNIWVRIQSQPAAVAELENHLTALYIAGAIRRTPSGGVGPRGMAISPDGSTLFVANYYSGTVATLNARTGEHLATISLGPQPALTAARRGEIVFHDARHAFQRWHSCASCHPNQGRVDGLRWDFLRDGIGNGKDTPSLIFVDQTPPHNRRAARKDVRECARTGLTAGHHPAPLFTDNKMHNIGVLSWNEADGRYDTPSLIEAYRTSPYLHDGRAVTLEHIFAEHDPEGRHGKANQLTEAELHDLVAFLRSL
jgi:YVTN family beta-propeller protein